MSQQHDLNTFDALRFNIGSVVLSSDESSTQVIESLLIDLGLATIAAAEQTAALVKAQQQANEHAHTANLIAYQGNAELLYVKSDKPRSEQANALNATILERLGLS